MLSDIPAQTDDRVLVDFRTADDAGVYRWESGPALVQTVDFFTPIVDDPYIYGQIAAANAVSDVYAMGGRPLTALAIAGVSRRTGSTPDTIRAIFRGGFDKLREAGVALLGGHTVQDQEIKFGYAVTGAIDPDARAGQRRRAAPATCCSSPSRSAPASSAPRSSSTALAAALADAGRRSRCARSTAPPPRRCRRCRPAPCTRAPTSPASG